MTHPLRGAAAITGLGMTPMGRSMASRRRSSRRTRCVSPSPIPALPRAISMGCSSMPGITGFTGGGISLNMQNYLGLDNLRLLNHMNAAGSTAAQMVQYATMAIAAGMATHVVCVFADAPLREGSSSGAAYGGAARNPERPKGMAGLYPGGRLLRRKHAVRARRPPAHGAVRHDAGPTRRHRRRASASGRRKARSRRCASRSRSRTTTPRAGSSSRCTCSIAAWSRTAPWRSSSALPTGPKTCPNRRSTFTAWARDTPATAIARAATGRRRPARIAAKTAYGMAGVGPRDVDCLRVVRLLHVYRARHARRLRVLREGRRRPVRRGWQAGPGRSLPATPAAANSRATTCGA